ncbi:MAG: DUF350 domain-containing protein [Planctomycetes bacterium]|nr:DUF350 domain-containing protein [Planctomycetota bacterium]
MNWEHLQSQVISTVVFGTIGIILFAVAFKVIERLLPFSLHKEIEHDQNTALAIVMGSILLGLAIIVAAAIHG